MALEMRERCERCAWPLATDDDTAYICSYECTFCATCANTLNGICPNCAAEHFKDWSPKPRPGRKKDRPDK